MNTPVSAAGAVLTRPDSGSVRAWERREELSRLVGCAFIPRSNPAMPRAHVAAMDWCASVELAGSESGQQKLAAARMERLVGRFYPHASPDALILATKLLCWAFVLDDLGDETELGRDAGRMDAFLRAHETALVRTSGGDAASTVRALSELRGEFSALGGARAVAAFDAGVRDFFAGLRWESVNRLSRVAPALGEFIRMRPSAGAAALFINIIEPMNGAFVPHDQRDSLALERMRRTTANAVCWINDILSVPKELRHEDVHNLVLVLMAAHGCDMDTAVAHAVAMYEAEIDLFSRAARSLWASERHPDMALQQYVSCLQSMIRGTLDWTLESERYGAGA